MKVHNTLDNLPEFRNPAITLGTFDGVHLGHRKIISHLKEAARKVDGESVLLTFWPHPRMVLQPGDDSLKLLNTIEEKTKLLAETGIDHLVVVPFTQTFSRLSYLEFVRDILVNTLGVKYLVVGHDHHFGKNREGTFEQLQECAPLYRFALEQVPALLIDGVSVSSSKIRNAILNEQIDKANEYLGYSYSLTGKVVHGEKRGRTLGFPTANVEVADNYKLMPADGIYAVEVEVRGELHKGMASLGYNPTFFNGRKTLEVNILDFDSEIYNEILTVRFSSFLRKELKFVNSESLVKQIELDRKHTIAFFSKP